MRPELIEIMKMIFGNLGKVLGVIFGFIIGLTAVFFGFFKAVMFLLFILAGYYIGKHIDNRESIKDIIDRIISPGER